MLERLTGIIITAAILSGCGGKDVQPPVERSEKSSETPKAEVRKVEAAKAEVRKAEASGVSKLKDKDAYDVRDSMAQEENLDALNAELKILRLTVETGFKAYRSGVISTSRRKLDLSSIDSLPTLIDTGRISRLEKMLGQAEFNKPILEGLETIVRRANTYNKSVKDIGDFFPKGKVTIEEFERASAIYSRTDLRVRKLRETLNDMFVQIQRSKTKVIAERLDSLKDAGRMTEWNAHKLMIPLKALEEGGSIGSAKAEVKSLRPNLCSIYSDKLMEEYSFDIDSSEAKSNLSRRQLKAGKNFDAAVTSYFKTLNELCVLVEDGELEDEDGVRGLKSIASDFAKIKNAFAKMTES